MKLLKNLKAVLTSSKFFTNWWVLPLHFLTGANTFNVKCRDEGVLNLNSFEFKRVLVALRDSLIKDISCIDKTFTAANGFILPLDKLFSLDYVVLKGFSKEGCLFDFLDGYWIHRVTGLKFKELRTGVVEVLCLGHYPLDDIDLRGKEVVDIGAYVGDSTLYFLYKGAEKVIAIEPHPHAYEELLHNLEINSVKDRVITVNAALGGRERTLRIPVNLTINETFLGFDYLGANVENGMEIKVITLEEVMKYIRDPYLIKMDCEGCEYEVINYSFSSLLKFKYIFLEYHNANISEHRKALEKLLNNFVCREIPYEVFTHREERGVILCRNRELT